MAKLSSSLAGVFMHTPGMGLPALPGNLGLPAKPVAVGQGFNQGKNPKDEDPKAIAKQVTDANNYNQALAQLLGQQSQLNVSDRGEIYGAYKIGVKDTHKGNPLADYSSLFAQTTQPQQEQQSAPSAQTVAPAAGGEAPPTVGPTPNVPVTPAVSTPVGNVAGQTTTTGGGKESPKARRGRFATLLAGLGGSVEKFGA